MNAQQHAYVLPLELHQVLAVERISVSPTGEQPGQGADFYAFVFDLGQEDAVNAFGGTPTKVCSFCDTGTRVILTYFVANGPRLPRKFTSALTLYTNRRSKREKQ